MARRRDPSRSRAKAKRLGSLPDPLQWALAQYSTIGGRCALCRNTDRADYVRPIVEAWASGRTRPGAVSWEKIARLVRQVYGTKTTWDSLRRHFQNHEPKLHAKLEKRRRGEA